VHKHVSLLRNADGHPSHIIVLVTDMSERKRHEEHVHLLMREVSHRAKNMLSLVLAIARQTASTSSRDFVRRFEDRIQSLSAAQELLVKHDWKSVPLIELIRSQLSHFADLIGTRVSMTGPALSINPAASQAIGMALHELATNAAKYGALSTQSGRIAIAWDARATEAAEPQFTLSWTERGGPTVRAPIRRGFGSLVTSSMIKMSLRGEVLVEYAAGGLAWRLDCPASEVIDGHFPPIHIQRPTASRATADLETSERH
jgi:two-component sensor histidine kinase